MQEACAWRGAGKEETQVKLIVLESKENEIADLVSALRDRQKNED